MFKSVNKFSIIFLVTIILLALSFQNAKSIQNIVPENRRIDWQPGITRGIPDYPVSENVKDFGAVGDGIVDDTQSFESAINAAAAGSAVYIPAGTYLISSTLEIGKGIVLKGEGHQNSKLKFSMSSGGACIKIVKWGGSDWADITSGFSKGSNSITVSNVSHFNVGDFVEIRQDNDPAVFTPRSSGSESWGDACVGQILEIIEKSGNTLIFSKVLYYNYNSSMNPRIRRIKLVKGAGVENLYIERVSANNYGSNIELLNAAYCWIKKVWSEKTITAHVFCSRTYCCEIRDSYFFDSQDHGSGGKGYGVRMEERSTDNLIENNIFKRLRHSIVVQLGATGNVFGYNYSKDPFFEEGNNWLMPDVANHGHYPYLNLFEGNIVQQISIDNVHGTNGPTTIFRNRIEKDVSHYLSGTEKFSFIEIEDNNPYQNIIGNELGIESTQAYEPIKLDPSIANSIIVHGNYNFNNNALLWEANIADHNLPASLYLNQKPSWFGSLPWPVLGGDISPNMNKIPAQQRYQNNRFIPGSPSPPQNLRANIRY